MMRLGSLFVPLLLALVANGANAQDAAKKGSVSGTLTTEVKLMTRGAASQAEMVLYLVPKGAVKPVAKGTVAEVRQKKLKFVPRVLPVQTGTTVSFVNQDRVTHNVFVDTECCKLDVDMDKGKKKEHTFAKKGVYPVVCRLHPEMRLSIIVVDSPYFTATKWKKSKVKNEAGKKFYTAKFELKGIPPGKYTLRSWNKKLAGLDREIEVKAGVTSKTDLALKK